MAVWEAAWVWESECSRANINSEIRHPSGLPYRLAAGVCHIQALIRPQVFGYSFGAVSPILAGIDQVIEPERVW